MLVLPGAPLPSESPNRNRPPNQPLAPDDDQENHTPALFPGTLWHVPASNTVAYFLKTGTAVREAAPGDDLCTGQIPPTALQGYAALLRELYTPLLEQDGAHGRDAALAGLLREVQVVGGALDRAAMQLGGGRALRMPTPSLLQAVRACGMGLQEAMMCAMNNNNMLKPVTI